MAVCIDKAGQQDHLTQVKSLGGKAACQIARSTDRENPFSGNNHGAIVDGRTGDGRNNPSAE